ncbi:hypothetical protein [Saccharicrinis aurantiacus]|uniref:hypothetical protein n=1 Tax=Saccharicrinis aurantiacus TaxID=1849719 RepID=UPI00094F7621|nr:hypothetical protein [Saccharicrinis aurantiacus]
MKYFVVIYLAILIYGCENNIENPVGRYPLAAEGPILIRNLIISESMVLKSNSTSHGFIMPASVYNRELDLERLVHNYQYTGYTVKVFRAWVSDDSNPNGGYYTDLEFENIDLKNHNIEFETAGEFEVEVIHPDFNNKNANYSAYYEFKKTEFLSWPENEPLIIDMELGQHAVFLVYQTIDVYFTIDWMKIKKNEVVEYQPIYIEDNKGFEIEIKHKDQKEIKQRVEAGDNGTCQFYWVESSIELPI